MEVKLMRSKNFIIIASVLIIALFFTFSCKGGGEESTVTEAEQKVEAEQEVKEEVKQTGKMNDDLFVEITAQVIYIGHKYGSDDPKRAGDPKNILKKNEDIKKMCHQLGVTFDEYYAYRDKLEDENFSHYRELLVKANTREYELRKGEK